MKRFILPTIKVLIALVIAVALSKLAFFPSKADPVRADIEPGFEVVTPTVTVTRGDIPNQVKVTGQVVQDAAVPARATLAGVIESFAVESGATVEADAPLLRIRKTEPQPPQEGVDKDGNPVTKQVPDKVTHATVTSPIAGKVTFQVIKDQDTTVGSVVATVSPGTHSATGTITAAQQYKLLNPPTTATITVDGGPAPFECTGLVIGVKENSPSGSSTPADDAGAASPQDGTSVQVRCPIPPEQTVFPGLQVSIGIDQGSAKDALLVPVTAVEGSVSKGNVWVLADPADPSTAVKREISLGVNDGTNVQVTEGLSEGDTLLQFVPNKDIKRKGTPNTCEPDGSACYDENGEETQ
ncbi:efflux RND transporter periplasmic adaptor subunit [Actinomyces weissii]|uniref:Efflux RND transporter periplasmic adaptor subunit n=1 Tax=Actinomyces weissii TaxID=675090 RepID=A0A7T7S2W4_9ACTO|nr:efflux RND transporter periplasmic adaptor subunit [Actinomyces weissii]QQM67874.1 efflux RND transporter periplasmic adaptor subunit [Actinomyces weissii]